MKKIISQEELKEFKEEFKGEERGVPVKSEGMYILEKKGEDGLRELEEVMADLGYPLKYKEIKFTHFYPIIYEVLTLVAINRIFGYDEKEIEKMGRFALKIPSVVRSISIMRKFFPASLTVLNRVAPRIWEQYYMIGKLEIAKYDEEGIVLQIKDYHHHPLNCYMIKGALGILFQLLAGKKSQCEETKCIHRGDDFHEFSVKWQE